MTQAQAQVGQNGAADSSLPPKHACEELMATLAAYEVTVTRKPDLTLDANRLLAEACEMAANALRRARVTGGQLRRYAAIRSCLEDLGT